METGKVILIGDMEHVDYDRIPDGFHMEGLRYDFYAVKDGYKLTACLCAAHAGQAHGDCDGDVWGVKAVPV